MDRMNRRYVPGGTAVLTLLTALSFAFAANAQAPARPIKFGGLTFLTGKFSSYGQDASKGMQLAVKQINDAGGVMGSKLELDLQDTASDSAQAVTLLRRFAASPDIVGVVGPTGTPDLLAALPLSRELGLPIVSLGSQKELAHSEFGDWLVRVNLMETPALIKEVLVQTKKLRKIDSLALLRDRANDFGQAEAKSVRKAIESNVGVKLVADEAYAAGEKDFAAVADKVLREKPDAIWIAGVTNEAALIIEQARARGFKGIFIGGAGLNDPKIAQLAKEAATGTVTFLPVNYDSPLPPVKKFVAGYHEAYGQGTISTYAAYGYDAVMLLANAVNTAKSNDRAKVMKALGNTKNFVTVTGNYTFMGKGDNTGAIPFLVEVGPHGDFKSLN